jgi:hypothetical protein
VEAFHNNEWSLACARWRCRITCCSAAVAMNGCGSNIISTDRGDVMSYAQSVKTGKLIFMCLVGLKYFWYAIDRSRDLNLPSLSMAGTRLPCDTSAMFGALPGAR